MSKLQFNADFTRYFPHDDEDYQFYQTYINTFQGDQEQALVGLEFANGVLNPVNLNTIASFTDSLESLEEVIRVQSLTNTKYFIRSPMGMMPLSYVHLDGSNRKNDSLRMIQSPLLRVLIDSSMLRSTLVVDIQNDLSIKEFLTLKEQMVQMSQHVGLDDIQIAGRAISIAEISTRILREMILFMGLALLAIVIILWRLYKRIVDIVIPILTVVSAAAILLGMMGFLGKSIDLMSSLLPAIMFVIGMADIIHINTHYRELIRKGNEKKQSIRLAIKEVGLATFITSATTAVGFLTLLTSDIPSIRQFATFAATGIMIAFGLAISLYPAILYLTPAPEQNNLGKNTGRLLPRIFLFGIRNARTIALTSMVLLFIGGSVVSNLRVDNYLSEDLPQDHPIRKSYTFMDNHFGGVRTMELVITPSKQVFDQEVIRSINKLEQYLESNYHASILLSAAGVVKSTNQALMGGILNQYSIPTNANQQAKVDRSIERLTKSGSIDILYNEATNSTRIFARIPDWGGRILRQKNAALLQFADAHLPGLKIRLTGMPYLIDMNNQKMVEDMMLAIATALLLVGMLMGFLFRNLTVMLSAFIANLIPLLLIVAVLVAFDIYINIPTAVIFTIAFGISVDDSIHFLSRVKVEMGKGRSLIYAIKRSVVSTGKAVIYTSLILFAGFGSMLFSDFGSTSRFGLLVSLCLVFALLADLFLLPSLLVLLHRKKN
ncbi:MAG: MMPL family transporter [Cyclobacteriaceae bacterium]